MKYKLYLSFALVCLFFCASCNDIDDIHPSRKEKRVPIAFSVSMDQTRTTLWTDFESIRKFKIWAYEYSDGEIGENIIPGVTAEVNNGQVTLYSAEGNDNPEYFWPDNGTAVVFYAIPVYENVPFRISEENANEVNVEVVSSGPSDSHDLVAASCVLTRNKTTDGYVQLHFHHILSKVSFAAKVFDTEYDYKIEEITMQGPNKGVFDLNVFHSAEDIENPWTIVDEGSVASGQMSYDIFSDAPLSVRSTTYEPLKVELETVEGEGGQESQAIQCYLLPSTYTLFVKFSLYNKETGDLVDTLERTVPDLVLAWGLHSQIRLGLVSDALNVEENHEGETAD